MKLVGLSEVYENKYDDVQFSRQGLMGRNKQSGVRESLPSNAMVLQTLLEVFPALEALIAQKVESEVRLQLDRLLAEAEDAGKPT
jgi:hypothetical protein